MARQHLNHCILSGIVAIAVLCGCQAQRKSPDSVGVAPLVSAPAERNSKIVFSELEELTRDRGCASDTDCSIQTLGSDGCGDGSNPLTYLAYSPSRTQLNLFAALVAEFNTLQLQEIQNEPPPGNAQCGVAVAEPTLTCEKATWSCELVMDVPIHPTN